ncbi:hypothetical protein [Streptomyces pratensis]|uniref:hypothetical protein n=1 Tax=Streptomyces pratensis TaxID=1169025 RepID=UPI00362F2571
MRDATARIVLSILTAILMAVQFPVPATPFASAHSALESAPGPSETRAAGPEVLNVTQAVQEYAPCGPPVQEGDPHGALRTRDRHRAAVQCTTDTLSRCLVTGDTEGRPRTSEPVGPAVPHHASRSSASHSPAALQVFRC